MPKSVRKSTLKNMTSKYMFSAPSGGRYTTSTRMRTYASREHFREVLGFDKDRITAIGYWFRDRPRS